MSQLWDMDLGDKVTDHTQPLLLGTGKNGETTVSYL